MRTLLAFILVSLVLISGCIGSQPQLQDNQTQSKPEVGVPATECTQGILGLDYDGTITESIGIGSIDREVCWVRFKAEDGVFVIESPNQGLKIFKKSGNSALTANFVSSADGIILGTITDGEIGQNAASLNYYYNDILGEGKYYEAIAVSGSVDIITATDMGTTAQYKADLEARRVGITTSIPVAAVPSSNTSDSTDNKPQPPDIPVGDGTTDNSDTNNITAIPSTGNSSINANAPKEGQKLGHGTVLFNNMTLVFDGNVRTKIVIGEGMNLADYGVDIILGNISSFTGASLEVITRSQVNQDCKDNYNVIVVGGPQVNQLTSELMQSGDSETDWAVDGGSIETIPNFYTTGRSVFIIAGKDAATTKRASEGFVKLLEFKSSDI